MKSLLNWRSIALTLIIILVSGLREASSAGAFGSWQLLVSNSGVSAMHMAVSHTNKVLIFDRTDYGPSTIKLPDGRCRNDSADRALKVDCWAHSVELEMSSMSIRPLEILTDTWCSSASFISDGTLIQTGGWNDGARVVRRYNFCEKCDWIENSGGLTRNRWYASNQILPDNRVIVIGGRVEFSYEFVPGDGSFYNLPFLRMTYDRGAENNLYPFVHLLPDGSLFIFANSESILLDYKSNTVRRRFPSLPGGSRSYPASGSSVMLPLVASDMFKRVEVLICGGAPKSAYQSAGHGEFLTALQSCGRMVVTDENPEWSLEDMPGPRVMGDMINLPSGEILIINGCKKGSAGWRLGRDPELSPVIYNPGASPGSRFRTLVSSSVPRMYHSTAILLLDGRVLVAGSNPNVGYEFSKVMFPTELRIEAFSPPYLDPFKDSNRPNFLSLSAAVIGYSEEFTVEVGNVAEQDEVEVSLYASAFATHAYTMNQRHLVLGASGVKMVREGVYGLSVKGPPSKTVAPAGYYMVFLVNHGVPSHGKWLRVI